MLSEKEIEIIKKETSLCDTFCCYENCEKCVERYLKVKEVTDDDVYYGRSYKVL